MRFFCSASLDLIVSSSAVSIDTLDSRAPRVFWVEASSSRIWAMLPDGAFSGGAGELLARDALGCSVFESAGGATAGSVGAWACFQAAAERSASLVSAIYQLLNHVSSSY
jgi:hypothetical protein